MSQPKTLLQLSGADLTPAALSQSVVVTIDQQNEYVTGMLPLTGIEKALAEGARVLERARAAGAPIIHVVHKGGKGGPFDLEGPGGQLADLVAAKDGEPLVAKPLPNAFAQTTLQDEIDKTGRKSLIVTGFMTHMCVSSTVRAALDLGYSTTVVANACATRPLPTHDGGVIEADALHLAALTELGDRFAVIVDKADKLGN